MRALLESCRRHMGVRGAVGVRLSNLSASPSVCGLRRPVILMPEPMTRQLQTRQLRSVLFHELAHVKRGDLWVNLVQTLLQIAYLYHPLLWLANVYIRRIREQAVDEAVLAAMGEDAEDYPRTLLSISKLAFGQPALSLRLLGVVESKKALTARIRHIVSRPFPSSAKLGLAGLALVLTVGAVLLPMARAKSDAPVAVEQVGPSGPPTLETLRQLVARNEALINPIQLDYTVQIVRRDEAQLPSAGGRVSRPYSHRNLSWAQCGSKQYVKEATFFEPNEPGRTAVTILDDNIRTDIQLPDRMEASIQSRDSFDYASTLPGKLEMRPSQGQQALTDLLVPDYAVLHPDTEVVKGRPAYVIDVSRPLVFSAGMRIWLDREAGVPVRVQHLDRHPTVPHGQVFQEVNDVSLHRLPNGGWIPIAGVRTTGAPFLRSRQSIAVDVNSIRLGPQEVPESLFQVDLPPGAVVRDARSGMTSIVGQPAKTYEQVVVGGGRFLVGTVVDETATPVPGVVASAIVVSTPQEDGRTSSRTLRPSPCMKTDALGRFAVELPEEGSYDLRFRHPDFAYAALNGVPLGARGLRVTLDKGGAITGRVVRMVNGRKVPAANAEVQTFAPNTPTLRSGQIRAITDAEGRFEFKCLDTNRSRPRFGREQELAYNPISWRVFCGQASTSVQFEKGVHTQEVELMLRPDPAVAPSLVGRGLPGLEGLGVNLRAEDAKGKMVLACFFDLNQRPARRCVEELAQKAQELKDNGIAVVAVQAAQADAEALATWRRDARVSFPIGAIREDIPERRYVWSVRSLPWLILTDRSHVVQAEGFDLSELQAKVEAVQSPSVAQGGEGGAQDSSRPSEARLVSGGSPVGRAPAGVVVDERGMPVSGARVLLYHRVSSWGLHNQIVDRARTDAQGRFALAKALQYKNSNGTDYTDHFLLFATHPDHALTWQVIVGGAEKSEYRLTMTVPVTQTVLVTDREGKPLAQARVWISGAGRNDEANPLLRPGFRIPQDIDLLTATTDEQGLATLGNLPRTYCTFFASLPGYSNRLLSLGTPPQGQVRIQMTQAGTAKGQVLTKAGRPVAGAEISFQADWGEWYFDYAVTDETGHFINDRIVARGGSWVSGGGTGQYKVSLRHPKFAAPDAVIQLDPGTTEEFNIEAVEGTRLRVQVLEPETERPIPGARIAGSSASGRIDGYSDANGVFERCVLNGQASVFFQSPPGGTYVISNRSSGSPRVAANGGVENITLYAPSRLHPLVALKGRLQLPDGSPAAGVKISTTNHMERYQTAAFSGRGSAYARTNPDGSFELPDVPRDAEVFLYGETSDHAYVLAEVLDPAQVSPELTQPLVMREGRTASVVLTDAAGKPRANMGLKLRPRKWEDHVFRADDRSAATDAEGRLTLDGVVPGLEYFIRDAQANMSEPGWSDLYHENRVLLPTDGRGSQTRRDAFGDPSPAAPVTAPPTAEKAGGEISGVVLDSTGKPIAEAVVTLENKDLLLLPQTEKLGAEQRRVMRPDNTQTDPQGRFRFTGLVPGKTTIIVTAFGHRTACISNISTGMENLRAILGEPVSYRLSGVALDEFCKGVPDVAVTFVEETLAGPDKGKDEAPVTVYTDERGTYRFDRLLPPADRRSVRRLLYARKAGYGAWGYDLDTTGGQATGQIRLPVEEKVSGVVKNESGEPIAGATVALRSGWNRWGSFSFPPAWQNLAPQATT